MMGVLHHVIQGLGPFYDPMAADVIALVQGGGPLDNTGFADAGPLGLPLATLGSSKSLGFGSAPVGVGSAITANGGVGGAKFVDSANQLKPSDAKFNVFTVDGWVWVDAGTTRTVMEINLPAGGGYPFRLIEVQQSGGSTFVHVYTLATYYDPVDYVTAYPLDKRSLTIPGNLSGSWLYFHVVMDSASNYSGGKGTLKITAGGASVITHLADAAHNRLGYGAINHSIYRSTSNHHIWWGNAAAATAAKAPSKIYSLRLTRGERAYNAAMLSLPMPVFDGTPNTMGAPGAGVSEPGVPGQVVLAPNQAWVVPAGVTSISAVAVGCKLTMGATQLLAATWPVDGEGGGQGGPGGVGSSEVVQPPPVFTGSFGGGGGGPTYYYPPPVTYYYPGGGGGAGGYGGKGGDGAPGQGSYNGQGAQGAGGGGKGGYGGGGVGLKGRGASGNTTPDGPGSAGSANGPTYGGGPGGAPGSSAGGVAGNHLAWRNAIAVTPGQTILCTYIGAGGASGAARIIWGDARSFPANAGDV